MMGRGRDDERWKDVPRRLKNDDKVDGFRMGKNKGDNITKLDRMGKNKGDNITKFFITNLPNGCRPWVVADFVGGYGEVVGMYIARKKDKEGKRFGFLSLKNVKDARVTEKVLNGLKLGGCNLRVNIAKFDAENMDWWDADVHNKKDEKEVKDFGMKSHKGESSKNVMRFNEGWLNEGVSFRDMLKQEGSSSGEETTDKVAEVHEETSAFFDLQGRAVVGRVKDITTLVKMNLLLKEAGVSVFKIYYLGALNLLILFEDEIDAADFLLSVNLWSGWFSSLDMWAGQSM
ncbi:putative RNA recognition motif domain, nucleotide-binding alpha-beta plait domain superfamily [Helianthus annuus]|nr:putative RNA recognition motif domain, nucleotide-binding alpha-beta plait domain superfamily [Helianthus annuus]